MPTITIYLISSIFMLSNIPIQILQTFLIAIYSHNFLNLKPPHGSLHISKFQQINYSNNSF